VNHHGLYTLFYQYFTKRWENQDIPEYDFQTDELVYRSRSGTELRREPLGLDERRDPISLGVAGAGLVAQTERSDPWR
jgi:hypothetical protein